MGEKAVVHIDYEALEKEKALELQSQFTKKIITRTMGHEPIDSLRHTILKLIVENNYEKAHSELDRYIVMKSDYPSFQGRSAPLVKYAHEIIYAVEAKRNFPGLVSLSASKHQELLEKVLDHFEELKHFLKQIEIVEKEVKVEDMRSTVMVLKTLVQVSAIILLIGFVQAFTNVRANSSFMIVLDDAISRMMDLVFSFF